MKKFLGVIVFVLGSFQATQAATVNLNSLSVTYAHVNALFLGGGIDLDVTTTDNLLGGYINSITATNLPPAGIQTLYTAATNQNPNGLGPAAGSIAGGPAPTGTIDLGTNAITVDMSSFFANHGPMDQNLGGIATGFYNPLSGNYLMSWTAVLSQGPAAGEAVTFTFGGHATVVPVPAAAWLFGTGLIGLVAVARKKVSL